MKWFFISYFLPTYYYSKVLESKTSYLFPSYQEEIKRKAHEELKGSKDIKIKGNIFCFHESKKWGWTHFVELSLNLITKRFDTQLVSALCLVVSSRYSNISLDLSPWMPTY
jgi:hypothetical protein